MINMNGLNFDVEVEVGSIISTLQNNRDEHISDYQEAVQAFQTSMVIRSKEAADRIAAGDFDYVHGNFGLTKPVDCTKDYDNMIVTFQAVSNATIVMDVRQLNMIMANSWDWLSSANSVNAFYSQTLRSKLA